MCIKVNIFAQKMGYSYNISAKMDTRIATLKFDTGASSTIISTKHLGLTKPEVQNSFAEYCKQMGKVAKTFHTATNEPFLAYSTYAKDVLIGNTVISDFYYYVIPDNTLDLCVLGDDFIDCCKYTHEPHNGIIIDEFDLEYYKSFHDKVLKLQPNILNTEEIISFIQQCDISKEIDDFENDLEL